MMHPKEPSKATLSHPAATTGRDGAIDLQLKRLQSRRLSPLFSMKATGSPV